MKKIMNKIMKITVIGLPIMCAGCYTLPPTTPQEIAEHKRLNERLSGDPIPLPIKIYELKF